MSLDWSGNNLGTIKLAIIKLNSKMAVLLVGGVGTDFWSICGLYPQYNLSFGLIFDTYSSVCKSLSVPEEKVSDIQVVCLMRIFKFYLLHRIERFRLCRADIEIGA